MAISETIQLLVMINQIIGTMAKETFCEPFGHRCDPQSLACLGGRMPDAPQIRQWLWHFLCLLPLWLLIIKGILIGIEIYDVSRTCRKKI